MVKNKAQALDHSERKRFVSKLLSITGLLFFTQPSFGHDVPLDLFENFVESRCVVMSPIFDPVINSDSVWFPSAPPYDQGSTLVAHYRSQAEAVHREMVRIAATFDFDTLEQWAAVGDRVWIVMRAVTAGPGMYDPIPAGHVVIPPESLRVAGEVYLRITELLQTVTDEEKQLIRPHVDALQVSCIEFRR